MKTKLLLIILLFMAGGRLQAQHCHAGGFKTNYSTSVISTETGSLTGSLNYLLKIEAFDSVWIDSLTIDSNFFFWDSAGLSAPIFLDSGDTVSLRIFLKYDTNALPYYYRLINHRLFSHNSRISMSHQLAYAFVYFTPYNTCEIWDQQDFDELPRKWEIPKVPEPARVYIHRDSIPISDRPPLDSLKEDWETDFQVIRYAGLPYAIEMKAIPPDTMNRFVLDDSLFAGYDTGYSESAFLVLRRRFTGRVTGRLVCDYWNDNAELIPNFALSGIKVMLKEDDGIGNRGSNSEYNRTLTETYTDDNGFFDLSYDVHQAFSEGNDIEIYLEFQTINYLQKFKVKRRNATPSAKNTPYSSFTDLGTVGREAGTINLGNVFMPEAGSRPFRTANFTNRAFRFFDQEAPFFKPTKWLSVGLRLDNQGGLTSTHYRPLLNTILLEAGDELHETIIWHEFGHYVMYNTIFNTTSMNLLAAWQPHVSEELSNFELAWSEGWASGFMQFVDVFYNRLDNEDEFYCFFYANDPDNEPVRENCERFFNSTLFVDNPTATDDFNGVLSNGFESEYLVTTVLRDLYDGPDRNLPDVNDWNDVANSNNRLANDGYEPGEEDDLELSANFIFAALSNDNFSIEDFYVNLIKQAHDDCETKKKIKKVFDQNRISLLTSNLEVTEDLLSSDEILRVELLNNTGRGFDITDMLNMDINLLNSAPHSWNIISNKGVSDPDSKMLTDNLTIETGGSLFVNNFNLEEGLQSNRSGIFGTTFNILNLDLCAENINVLNNGTLKICDGDFSRATVRLRSGSLLSFNSTSASQPSTLYIHNHSKFTIEEGATLRIGPNTRIILNGPDAILHIKGNLELLAGVTFKIEGGSEGIGRVVWENWWNNTTGTGTAKLIATPTSRLLFGQDVLSVSRYLALEVLGNDGLRAGWDLGMLDIKNCFVKLGPSSRIVSEAERLWVYNSEIEGFYGAHANTSFNYKLTSMGLHVLGKKNSITETKFKNCYLGCKIFNVGTNEPLRLNDVDFENCFKSVLNEAGTIIYRGGEITGTSPIQRIAGIEGIGTQGNNLIYNVNINVPNLQNVSGVSYTYKPGEYCTGIKSHGAGRYNLFTTSILEADKGIETDQAYFRPVCNHWNNNRLGASVFQTGTFDFSNKTYNIFEYPDPTSTGTTAFIKGSNKVLINFNNGYSSITGANYSKFFIDVTSYSLKPVLGNANSSNTYHPLGSGLKGVLAKGNLWNIWNGNETDIYPSGSPSFNNVRLQQVRFITTPLDLITRPTIAYGTFSASKSAECPYYDIYSGVTTGWYPTGSGLGTAPPYNTGNTVETAMELSNGLVYRKRESYMPSQDYPGFINDCKVLLDTLVDDSFAPVLHQLYLDVHTAYHEMFYDTAIDTASREVIYANTYSNLLGMQQTLLARSLNTDDPYRLMHFELVRDYALIHRMFNHRQDGIDYLQTEASSFSNPLDQEALLSWKCILEREQMYLDSLIPYDSVFMYTCLKNYYLDDSTHNFIHFGFDPWEGGEEGGGGVPQALAAKVESKTSDPLGIVIYPNPATNNAKIESNSPIQKIVVYDKEGRVIESLIVDEARHYNLRLDGYAEGVYFIEVRSTGKKSTSKLIILK